MPSGFINAHQFLPPARLSPEAIIGDAIEPGREFRFPAKTSDVFIGTQKSFLGKVVGQGQVGSGKLPEQAAHARLMPADQLAKGVLVIIDKNSSDKVRISKLHVSQAKVAAADCLSSL